MAGLEGVHCIIMRFLTFVPASSDYTQTTLDRAFVPGGPTSIRIPVPTTQDAIVEGNEEFAGVLTLTGSVPGIVLGPRDTAIAIIQDDDSMLQ